MHDDPEEGEGDEENVQESSRQSVRADALQEVLHQSNQVVGMQLQAEEGLPEDWGSGVQGRPGCSLTCLCSSRCY